ncbi:MAG: SPFH domain-containing protein [Oscillospiraceae bacterium]|nr:SPFH domain-containing protein [Oscillospiraceae bacterium]
MGIIRAIKNTITGTLADQWQEVIRAEKMSDSTVMTRGEIYDRKGRSKGTPDVISNGSIIHVEQNQFMILTDGGKIVDYTAEPGYFKVDSSATPSLFNGEFDQVLQDTFERFRFQGETPYCQKVYFINTQEIKNIAFGTSNPVNYFDNFYNAELFLRAFGYFSIRITDPLKFYAEALPRDARHVEISDIQELYLAEFLTAFQAAINQMSADGIRISHVTSKSMELAKYMANVLDEDWNKQRGMQIESVGIKSISYDDKSKELIEMRNQGAMLSDASIREGYVQGAAARGVEAAGKNSSGSMAGFMGMNMAMNSAGSVVSAASASNQAQMAQQNTANQWTCSCGTKNDGKFCTECGKPKATTESWRCSCGAENTGKFCTNCGKAKPQAKFCPNCGKECDGNFCPNCGQKL